MTSETLLRLEDATDTADLPRWKRAVLNSDAARGAPENAAELIENAEEGLARDELTRDAEGDDMRSDAPLSGDTECAPESPLSSVASPSAAGKA